nr:hypothetical protein [Pandoravirus massiliensis]
MVLAPFFSSVAGRSFEAPRRSCLFLGGGSLFWAAVVHRLFSFVAQLLSAISLCAILIPKTKNKRSTIDCRVLLSNILHFFNLCFFSNLHIIPFFANLFV